MSTRASSPGGSISPGWRTRRWSRWHGLQAKMTLSYVWMTLLLVLLLVVLGLVLLVFLINNFNENNDLALAQKTSVQYAYAATLQSDGLTLNPRSTFQPGQAYTLFPPTKSAPGEHERPNFFLSNLIVPYIADPKAQISPEEFALLIAPEGQIVASSYPVRYPLHAFLGDLLPRQQKYVVSQAFQGTSVYAKTLPQTLSCATTVWGKNGKVIGVLYLQGQGGSVGISDMMNFLLHDWPVVVGLILLALVITTPLGSLFGLLTTRGLVRRIHRLAEATTLFAGGDYQRRVAITRRDEVGQLEQDFNAMAEQLVQSTRQQQELASQNARLAERARISRELHDAISQDLFSLRLLAYGLQDSLPQDSELHQQAVALEQTSKRMVHEMRALLLELRPAHLAQLGLAEALNDLTAGYSERLDIVLTTEIAPVELQPEQEHALLRVAQEALANAVRHAHATQINLSLQPFEGGARLTIRDNGQGFVLDEGQRRHGVGLNSMQERIQELHGTLNIHTAPGQATEVIAEIVSEGGQYDSCIDCG